MLPTVTTTLPLVVPIGGLVIICVGDHAVGLAATPLNVTPVGPKPEPKPVPLIWIELARLPVAGDKPVIFGTTAKFTELLAKVNPPIGLFAISETVPGPEQDGTGRVMTVLVQVTPVVMVVM